MRSSIRIYKSIHTEVSIIHLLTMITAIVVNCFPVFSEETVDLNIKIPAKGRVYLKVIYKLKKEMVLIPVGHVLGFDENHYL